MPRPNSKGPGPSNSSAAARACRGLCQRELALFREVLGPDVEVTRLDHLLSGARRCSYRIRRAPAP